MYNGRNADTYNGAFPEVRTLLDVPADAEGADGRSEKFCRYESVQELEAGLIKQL